MKRTRLFHSILLLLAAVVLTACGGNDLPLPIGVTAIPTQPPTVTPGGMALMALATPAPATATPVIAPTSDSSTSAYLLTALPAAALTVSCPQPGSPIPPNRPATYNLYATAINQFLSAGGSVPALADLLREWGVLTDKLGEVSEAYDLTGDGVYEVMVVLPDPYNLEIAPVPGQMLVFGCYQEDYRLLYASDYGPGFGLPSVLYVGDMNANTLPEMVFFQERCQSGACVKAAQVLSWNPANEGFIALNVDTVGSADGRFSITDLDEDGIQEIMIQGGGMSTEASLGPPRTSTTVWDWNGLNYVRALTRLDPPLYRIHAVHDADRALEAGDGEEALRLYQEALENPRLGTWQVPNEQLMLRAYTLFKMMVAYAYLDEDTDALNVYTTLQQEHTAGVPSHGYALVGEAFWQAFQATYNMHAGCVAAAATASQHPQTVLFLNSYGPANRTYQIVDICPF